MASDVEICNLALAHLGDDATVASISPPEGSAQAEHCARFYPKARDSLLELHDWKFALRRAVLAPLDVATWNWSFAYALPNNSLRIVSILPSSAPASIQSEPFEILSADNGALMALTHLENATAYYTARVTDPSKFSPLFIDALAWLLASSLAGPAIKGDAGAAMARSCYQSFLLVLSQARVSDANQQRLTPTHTPAWLAGR